MRSRCLCFSKKILIFPCSGGSVLGEISDRVARKLATRTDIKMGCLAGILANTLKFPKDSHRADYVISLDGCPMACATRALRANSFQGVIALSVTNMTHGINIRSASSAIIAQLTQEVISLLKPGRPRKGHKCKRKE